MAAWLKYGRVHVIFTSRLVTLFFQNFFSLESKINTQKNLKLIMNNWWRSDLKLECGKDTKDATSYPCIVWFD